MIGVKEARSLLGDEYTQLTDNNIQCIIDMLYNLSKRVIRETINKKLTKLKKQI